MPTKQQAAGASLTGKTCLITGANSGIGKVTAQELARRGAHVVIVCRDRARGQQARDEIASDSNHPAVDLLVADLSSMADVRELAREFKRRYTQLHVLVNNAGLYLGKRVRTADGLETTFAVNYLAPFLLTALLLDVLKASAPARIVNVASSARSRIDFADLQAERGYDGMQAYAQSKQANVLFTYELARRLAGTCVTANMVDPGVVRSGLQRDLPAAFQVARLGFDSPEKGAQTSVFAATAPELEGVSGRFLANSRLASPGAAPDDLESARRLWAVSEQLVGLVEGLGG